MDDDLGFFLKLFSDFRLYFSELKTYVFRNLHISFFKLEEGKSVFAKTLYKQRGKWARKFVHTGMVGLTSFGMMIAPVIAQELPGSNVSVSDTAPMVLSAESEDPSMQTTVSEKLRGEIVSYEVQSGDTVSTIAKKFGVSEDTIRWQNNLKSKESIKVGQKLEILPVTGVVHKVTKGETVYSIAKKYDTNAQGIVDYPYNTFSNDETFELAIGQSIVIPDGVKKEEVYWATATRIKQITPDAGTVVASGQFIWPTQGTITQRFFWYHKGIDIANRAEPDVLAADSGKVTIAGWPDNSGYGNRVMVDHGNGWVTLYAHLKTIYVVAGQTVSRGSAIGKMGTTGRSTGTHLHFEVIKNGSRLSPFDILK